MIFIDEIERTSKERLDKIHMDLLNDKEFAMISFNEVQLIKKVFDYIKEQM